MDCPKGLPPGPCCGITKAGSTYVQKVLACQRDVLSKRVDIRKGGGDPMAVNPDRSMVRKALWDLMCQTAERLPHESRQPLSKAEALVATAQKYPNLYMSYTDAVTRGDPPSELYAAPVAKAAPSERDHVFATIMKRAADRAAATGVTKERALVDLTEADPSLYQQYLDAKP